MKSVVNMVVLTLLLLPIVVKAQGPDAGEKQKKLHDWVGVWTIDGVTKDSVLGPGGKFTGKNVNKMILNGYCLQVESETKEPAGLVHHLEMSVYDPVNNNYPINSWASAGYFYSGIMTARGRAWEVAVTLTAGEKKYKLRFKIDFSADMMSFHEVGDVSEDGKTWSPFEEARYLKVKQP